MSENEKVPTFPPTPVGLALNMATKGESVRRQSVAALREAQRRARAEGARIAKLLIEATRKPRTNG